MPRIRDRLRDFSREELTLLVERMIHREPDLIALLDTPPPGRSGTVSGKQLDREIACAFRSAARGRWDASFSLARQMDDLADLGREYLERGELENALELFAALSAGIRSRYETIHDEEGEVARVLDRCVDGFEACITRDQNRGAVRKRAMDALLDTVIWERDSGGYGVAEQGPAILKLQATADERARLAATVERRFQAASRDWSRRELGKLLLDLRGDALETEKTLDLLRRSGNHEELVERLLQLQRPEQAARVLATVDWVDMPKIADSFLHHGYRDRARRTVEQAIESRQGRGRWLAMDWMHRLAIEERDKNAQVRWAEALFWDAPCLNRWKPIRDAAPERYRRQLRERLRQEGQHLLLTRILLSENRALMARTTYQSVDRTTREAIEVGGQLADAIAARYPREAAGLWIDVAECQIKGGNREDYAQAAELVKRGRDALRRAGHPRLASQHVSDFRARHRRRRLLQQELDRIESEN